MSQWFNWKALNALALYPSFHPCGFLQLAMKLLQVSILPLLYFTLHWHLLLLGIWGMFCLTAKSMREKVDNFTQNCKKKEWLKHILVSHSTNSLAFVGYCVAWSLYRGRIKFLWVWSSDCCSSRDKLFWTFDPFSRKYWHHKKKTDCCILHW